LFSFLPQCAINLAISPTDPGFGTNTAIIFITIDVFFYMILYFYLDQVKIYQMISIDLLRILGVSK